MTYQENRELARIRGELRLRLMSRRYDGTNEILSRMEQAAPELHSECERWRKRFEMLA